MPKIVVSACLAGKKCRWDGRDNTKEAIRQLVAVGKAIPVCPEELGGLPTPREPSEIVGGSGEDVLARKARVVMRGEKDVTENFLRGAKTVLKIVKEGNLRRAILKTRSSACGYGEIYNGSFSGRLKPGNGVTTALLLREDIEIVTDEEYISSEKEDGHYGME